MTRLEKIQDAVYHHPLLIPELFRSINPGMVVSRLMRLVPYSIGIEFECEGNFIRRFMKDHPELGLKDKKSICRYFNIMDFSEDDMENHYSTRYYPTRIELSPEIGSCSNQSGESDTVNLNEIRVRIKNFSQLSGLYRILEEMKRYCKVCKGGGIHLHIDFTSKLNDFSIKTYISKHIQEVIDIFPEYTGTYNKKGVGIKEKGYYVNISNKGTIEFRIAPLTFNYSTLIIWMIKTSKFCSKIHKECKNKKSQDDARIISYFNRATYNNARSHLNSNTLDDYMDLVWSNRVGNVTGYYSFDI